MGVEKKAISELKDITNGKKIYDMRMVGSLSRLEKGSTIYFYGVSFPSYYGTYYEKVGLLKPAFIDENNGYRYYSAEQVSLLNKIILCIQLGIPLKEMVKFLDKDGNLESQKLLEQGRIVAKQRIQEMQNNLDYIEYSLKKIPSESIFRHSLWNDFE